MKRLAIIIAAVALFGIVAGTAQAKPDTFVKHGPVTSVEFGPGERTASSKVRCPGNSALTSGYVSFVTDSTPYGAKVVAQGVTADEQGWGATVLTPGLYSAGEETVSAKFIVNVICVR